MQHSHSLTMIELSKNFYFKSEEKGQGRDGVISEEGERPQGLYFHFPQLILAIPTYSACFPFPFLLQQCLTDINVILRTLNTFLMHITQLQHKSTIFFILENIAIKLTSVSASNYCHDIDHHHKNTIKTMVLSLYTCYF